jgi:hypothetical protein
MGYDYETSQIQIRCVEHNKNHAKVKNKTNNKTSKKKKERKEKKNRVQKIELNKEDYTDDAVA